MEHTTLGVSTPGVDASASYAFTGGEVGRDRLRLPSMHRSMSTCAWKTSPTPCGPRTCAPISEAIDRSKAIYCATVRAQGGDPNVGPHLPRFLAAAGLCDVQVTVAQPAAMKGATKRIWPLTMSAIREAAMAAGVIGAAAIDAVISDLNGFTERADSVIATPQVIQTWARRQR